MTRRSFALLAASALAAVGLAACADRVPAPASPRILGPEPFGTMPEQDVLADTDGVAALVAPGALHLVGNLGPVHFTMDAAGRELRNLPDTPVMTWLADGQLMQLVTVSPAQLGAGADEDDDARLLRHMAWEAAYTSRVLGAELAPTHRFATAGPHRVLIWSFPLPASARPATGVAATHTLLVTTVEHGHVIGLSSPVFEGQSVDDVTARMIAVIGTLAFSPTHLSVAAEQARLRGTVR